MNYNKTWACKMKPFKVRRLLFTLVIDKVAKTLVFLSPIVLAQPESLLPFIINYN